MRALAALFLLSAFQLAVEMVELIHARSISLVNSRSAH